jgi:Putative Ig domain
VRTFPIPCLLLLAGLAAPLAAQSQFVYAASEVGRVSANAYPLDKLGFNESDTSDMVWHDIFVKGADRWLIRGDGKISLNGDPIDDLADDDDWRGIVVDDKGVFFALRKGGKVSGPEGPIEDFPGAPFAYHEIITDGVIVYVLRTNGAVFRVDPKVTGEPLPLIRFDGPPGEVDDAEADGEAADTAWQRMAIHPGDGTLWAMRRDGVIKNAVIPLEPPASDPDPGTLVVALPYDNSDGFVDVDHLYTDFTFDVDGTWYALRSDGKLYNELNPGPPLVDFPGDASESPGEAYAAFLAQDGETLALRNDGKVFRDVETTALIDLKGSDYFGLAISDTLPNLENVKNQPPIATSMTVTAPEGSDIALPVLAVDRDKPTEDLVLDVDPETPLPAGATWDGVARVINWPAAGPAGSYKIRITVDDGVAKPVKAMQTIKIQTLDDNPDKNIKPVLAKVKKATALVGLPFSLPIIAFDRDGVPVTVTLDTSGKPLPAGVSFDEGTDTLLWDDPDVSDKGTHTFYFLVDDGTKVVRIGRKVKVDTSLLAF